MFSFFKKLFTKSAPQSEVIAAARPAQEPSAPVPTVEVAHLSLAAIVSRLPEDLKALVQTEPDASATVAFPIPTILKQLPSGAVRMSLASLHRQAAGVLGALPAGDKRMVEIPLAEIFRHVAAPTLRRRADQRPAELPGRSFDLFGNAATPYAIAPGSDEPEEAEPAHEPARPAGRTLQMDAGLRDHFSKTTTTAGSRPAPGQNGSGMRVVSMTATPAASSAPAAETQPPLILSLRPLTTQWPEEIREEIEGLDGETCVALPASPLNASLAKGRVVFTWGQIRSWLQPAPLNGTAISEETPLQLPLKIVAPAFLAASKKPAGGRASLALDESIPALFNSAHLPTPAPAPLVEATPPAPELTPAPPAEAAPELPAPTFPSAAPAAPTTPPESVGAVFGEQQKTDWTPAEIVRRTLELPGVAGAIVSLQEGLQVATSLPEGVKSEVIAAFLPQIFARLNQYAGEMRMGEVDDLLFTTHGAHCQIYRLGYIYFAVLGKPGEALPWAELRVIAAELARQTNQ